MTVHLKKVCQGLMAHLLIKNALYILIPSKLLNVSSDPQFEERVVERYGISIHIYEIFSNQCLLDTLHIGWDFQAILIQYWMGLFLFTIFAAMVFLFYLFSVFTKPLWLVFIGFMPKFYSVVVGVWSFLESAVKDYPLFFLTYSHVLKLWEPVRINVR